jgi:hypothetical protein
MADGRCVGKFPQNIIGDQRLPLRVVIDERLDMLGSPSDCDIKMPGAIDARKVSRSIDGPLGRLTPDPYKRLLAAFENCGRLVGDPEVIQMGTERTSTGKSARHLRFQPRRCIEEA